jgi:hypothetical protein
VNTRRVAAWPFVLVLWAACHAASAADPELRPFSATYSINGQAGSADIQLERLADGSWSYKQHIRVNSWLARLFVPAERSQRSLFTFQNDRLIPQHFTADDGAGNSSGDQKLDFDWNRGRVTGSFESKPVDLPLQSGVLDSLSVQVALMSELIDGRTPQRFVLVEKGKIREYAYTNIGTETLRTAMGEHRTVIYRSSRAGSEKTTVFWCAPDLGYLPLKVERRDGRKVEYTLAMKTVEFGSASAR